ncbi:hypothetical protein QQ045_006904 [Rhodiola kirilowii]
MCSSSSSSFYGVPREVDEEEDRRRRYHHLQGDLSDILVRSIFTTTTPHSDDDKFIIIDDDQHHHHHHQELLKAAAAQGNDDLQQADCVDLLTSGRHLGVDDDNLFASRADVDPLMMIKCTTNSTTSANNHVDTLMIMKSSNVLDHAASSYLNSSTATTFRSGLVTTPANKRRKSSVAKKVVCVPAPSPANYTNIRPSGEVVPCDLWAWRKYGQKPIKGSPYPRGYYRCSSSKSCSARKQVERSRKDPNMLVITYTSDHNHPWPTQRNALAGSTRSQSSKNYNNNRRLSTTNNNTSKHMMIDEHADHQMSNNTSMIKEELRGDNHAADNNQLYTSYQDNNEHTNYKPTIGLMPPAEEYYYDQHVEQNSQDDFFAEFGKVDGYGAAFSYLDYWPLLDHQMQTLLPLNDVPEAEEETEF